MKTFLRVLSIIILACWMGLIFFLSAQNAEQSSAVSGGLIETVAEKVYPEYENLTESAKEELISSFQHIVRKTAHFCIYMGLGFFAFLTFISYVNLKMKTRIFWMLFISIIYAASDEIHQKFVPGRSMELRDFLIDSCGVIMAVLICSLFVAAIRPLRQKVSYEKTKLNIKPVNYDLEHQDYDFSLNVEQEEPKEQELIMDNYINIENKEVEIDTQEHNQESLVSVEFEYAASVIGKTVVEATKTCNDITINIDEEDTRELVNLVLGRTEVLKAEILKILNSDNDFEAKKDLMKKEQAEAYDYFNSIKAQLG